LVNESIKKVVICNEDPFEQVRGRGIGILEDHGVKVTKGILAAEGAWLNRRFFCFHRRRRPYIILKWAQTDQGFFAPTDGTRLQISSRHSQQLVHQWRTEEQAILVGYRTALSDDPRLTARLAEGNQPLRIVLDRDLQLPQSLKVFQNDAPTWIVNDIEEAAQAHLSRIKLPFNDRLLPDLLGRLHQAGRLSLIVEGGAHTLQQFIDQDLWDEARVFVARAELADGIRAPQLTRADQVLSTAIGTDVLNVYCNARTDYPYVPGLAL
jgi:diaminohydroxyphosphoribosylaminopyrimidine deaminase/5-amino-6-(5-phosphoribosylamino)uracil reductase